MGMFSLSYINMTFKPTLLQRLKFLIAGTVRIRAESDDCLEKISVEFNPTMTKNDRLSELKSYQEDKTP